MSAGGRRPSLLGGRLSVALAALLVAGCTGPETTSGDGEEGEASSGPARRGGATAETGLELVYDFGGTGDYELPEVMGGGVALVDFDRDGDLDLFSPQGHRLGDGPVAPGWPPTSRSTSDRLLRNDLVGSSPRWTDVTVEAGIVEADYGLGVAVGDVDGDGSPDLYVANLGTDRLWRNLGDGTFEDATVASGLGAAGWSSSATFFDAEGDGDPDLYVASYVAIGAGDGPVCRTELGDPDYCGPLRFPATPDRFYRNDGRGRFTDETGISGIASRRGRGLGTVAVDADGDDRVDVFVANDSTENFLWINVGDGRFEERALASGCAVDLHGVPEASMGIAAGDADADGDLDLLVTHLFAETNTLYANDGRGLFVDASLRSGLGAPSFPSTGFGADWADLDHDGDLDLLVVNGRVRVPLERVGGPDPFPLGQPNQLFTGEGGTFTERVEAGWAGTGVSRGLALGDVDLDGDLDAVVVDAGDRTRLFLGNGARRGRWLAVLPETSDGVAAAGARVEVVLGDGSRFVRWVRRDGSYASARDPAASFGLGTATRVEVEVRWPDGFRRRLPDLPAGRRILVPREPVAEGRW